MLEQGQEEGEAEKNGKEEEKEGERIEGEGEEN